MLTADHQDRPSREDGNKTTSTGQTLKQRFQDLKTRAPRMRARDAAAELGVSEAELVACRSGDGITRLDSDWAALIRDLPELGEVKTITRNEYAVHEKIGMFDQIHIDKAHGLVLDPEINLRLFLNQWKFGFAVSENVASGLRHSLQFFDRSGTAIHKIYLPEGGSQDRYNALVEKYCSDDQSSDLNIATPTAAPKKNTHNDIDPDALAGEWADLQDVHDVFALLRKHRVSRYEALHALEGEFSWQMQVPALRRLLDQAAQDGLPIMCFVGNKGCIQIHTGPVDSLKMMGPWLNLFAETFTLHMREDHVEEVWVVKKPTRHGLITSLELFGPEETLIGQFFGERQDDTPERAEWRRLVAAALSQ